MKEAIHQLADLIIQEWIDDGDLDRDYEEAMAIAWERLNYRLQVEMKVDGLQ